MHPTEKNYGPYTRNMKSINAKIAVCCTILLLAGQARSQTGLISQMALHPLPAPKIHFNRFGPYVGLQRGRYTVVEFGAEKQFTRVKLIKPHTHAFHMGFNYNFKYNVLGYDLGYWYQRGRLNLTYGGNLVMRTDFNQTLVGITPVIGFKLFQFHLQTGYHFLTPTDHFEETNSFFVSLRFVLINDRDLDIDRKKKRKKK